MPWFVLTVLIVGVVVSSILDVVGVTHAFALWQNVVTLGLGTVALQAP